MLAFSPDVLVGDQRFRCCGTGKLTRAVDLALDKICTSKYSLRLGESPSGRAKSPKMAAWNHGAGVVGGEEYRVAVWLLA